MTQKQYTKGSTATLEITFRDLDGDLSDPTTVTLVVKNTDAETTYTLSGGGITRKSEGVYECSFTVDVSDQWDYTWESTGTPSITKIGRFYVTDVIATP